jgi:hypothetical protein
VPLATTPSNPVLRTGGIPSKDGRAWFKVVFSKPALGTPLHFRVSLTDSHGGEFKMNVRTACDAFASCSDGAGAGQGAASWEVATAYILGAGCCSDDQKSDEVLIEIQRTTAQASCSSYTVTFLNY